ARRRGSERGGGRGGRTQRDRRRAGDGVPGGLSPACAGGAHRDARGYDCRHARRGGGSRRRGGRPVRGRRRVIDQVSAGGVVYRASGAGPEVVICGNLARGTWSLPKGTPEPGEEFEQTAVREVSEETGLAVKALEPLGSIDYWFAMRGRSEEHTSELQ